MSTLAWQKACDCEGATATSGRVVIKDRRSPLGNVADAAFHRGPVCDSCDTPWTLVPVDTPPPSAVE